MESIRAREEDKRDKGKREDKKLTKFEEKWLVFVVLGNFQQQNLMS